MTDNSGASENNNPFCSAPHNEHVNLGAGMRNVGGYEVPLRYSPEIAEHNAVREAVSVFDLSLMGIIRVTSESAAAFLVHSLISAIKPLALGRVKYTTIMQEDGGRVRRSLHHG